MTDLLTDLTAATELRLDFLNANRLVNTGPHSPARALPVALTRKVAAGGSNSLGMERPDIPCPPLYESTHRLAYSGTLRLGGGAGKAPNLFDGRWRIDVLGQQWLRGMGRSYQRAVTARCQRTGYQEQSWETCSSDVTGGGGTAGPGQPAPHAVTAHLFQHPCVGRIASGIMADLDPEACNRAALTHPSLAGEVYYGGAERKSVPTYRGIAGLAPGQGRLFQHQPITPQRRLAGCDAGTPHGVPALNVGLRQSQRGVANRGSKRHRAPASLSFSWAAA